MSDPLVCDFRPTAEPGIYRCSHCEQKVGPLKAIGQIRRYCPARSTPAAPPTRIERKPGCGSCGQKQMLPAWTLAGEWYVALSCPTVCEPGPYLFNLPIESEPHAELESRGFWFPMQGPYELAELTFERRKDGAEKAALQFCSPAPNARCGPRWSSGWRAAGSFASRVLLSHDAGQLPPVPIEPAG